MIGSQNSHNRTRSRNRSLCIAEEHHEPHIHVVLLVTVKQRNAGIVGRELYINLGSRLNQHHIFDDPARLEVPGQDANLKAMPVQMDRMMVSAVVFELQPIPLSALE